MTRSNFGTKGNFEAVLLEGTSLVHYWRDNDAPYFPWRRSGAVGTNAASAPVLIQANFGAKGNFELVVKEGTKLRHYWRDNDASGLPWHQGVLFGSNVSSAPAMIRSNFGAKGNFELVVKEGTKLRHYWRDNDASGAPWHQGVLFGSNVSSAPAMIRSNFGAKGNFELVVKEGTKLRHYWRDNDASGLPWHPGVLFGDNVSSAPTLVQSNFGAKGNFELVAREGSRLRHYWRDNDTSGLPWHQGVLFSDHISGDPVMIRGNFGTKGNFELLARRGNCWTHFWRDNDAAGVPWSEESQVHATPPIGSAPTAAQRTKFLGAFPNLAVFSVTAPASGVYNCISWSVGVTNQWLWPGSTVAAFDAFYASYGWSPSASGKREYHKRKVALWATSSGCTHGSRETQNCDWHESKCGSWERILHDKFQMQGGAYGSIIKYYERADSTANADLA